MTIADASAEYQAICQYFADETDLEEHQIAWEGVPFKKPVPPADHVEFYVIDGETLQNTIGSPASNRFRTSGLVMVNVFTPQNLGKAPALAIAESVKAIFQGVRLSDDILFFAGSIHTVGVFGGYLQVNVSVPFTRDSFA